MAQADYNDWKLFKDPLNSTCPKAIKYGRYIIASKVIKAGISSEILKWALVKENFEID